VSEIKKGQRPQSRVTHTLTFRYAYLEILRKFGWSRAASLTMDGHKYSEYISHLQDHLQQNGVEFIMNRKFPKESADMSMVSERGVPLKAKVQGLDLADGYTRCLNERPLSEGLLSRGPRAWLRSHDSSLTLVNPPLALLV